MLPQHQTSLICNARFPLISDSKLRDELILYNIPHDGYANVTHRLQNLIGRKLDPDSSISTLSGGQKVVLMCLLALLSPAANILFIDLFYSLDAVNKNKVQVLLTELGAGRQISLEESK